jgi:hypothetical protein
MHTRGYLYPIQDFQSLSQRAPQWFINKAKRTFWPQMKCQVVLDRSLFLEIKLIMNEANKLYWTFL